MFVRFFMINFDNSKKKKIIYNLSIFGGNHFWTTNNPIPRRCPQGGPDCKGMPGAISAILD